MLVTTDAYPKVTIPEDTCEQVNAKKNEILGNVPLDQIAVDLGKCQGLINAARHGVAGFTDLEVKMTNMQSSFAKLCGKTELELENFGKKSKEIQKSLIELAEAIITEQLDDLQIPLEDLSDVAAKLSKKATELATEFETAGKTAEDILNDVQKTQGLERAKQAEIEQKIKDFTKDIEKGKVLLTGIAEQKKKLEKAYEEAKQKADKADDRAFKLALVGAIAEPLATMTGAFAGAYFNPLGQVAGVGRALTPMLPLQQPVQQADGVAEKQAAEQVLALLKPKLEELLKKIGKTQEDVKGAEDKAKKEKEELNKLTQQLKEAEEKKANSADQEKIKAEKSALEEKVKLAEKTAKDLKDTLNAQEEERKKVEEQKLKEEARMKGVMLNAVANGLNQVAENANTRANGYASQAALYNQEKVKYLEMVIAKEGEEYEQKAKEVEFTVQIKHFTENNNTLEAALASLFVAAGALRKLQRIFTETAQFWTRMGAACDQLKDSKLPSMFKANKAKETNQERIENFNGKRFQKAFYEALVGWKALELVCVVYAKEAGKVKKSAWDDFEENLSVESSRIKAAKLCEQLLEQSKNEMVVIAERKKLAISEKEMTPAITGK